MQPRIPRFEGPHSRRAGPANRKPPPVHRLGIEAPAGRTALTLALTYMLSY